MTFLGIKATTPLSKYLQTNNLNFMQAYQVGETTTDKLQKMSRDFSLTAEKAVLFVKHYKEVLEKKESKLEIEQTLPEVRDKRQER